MARAKKFIGGKRKSDDDSKAYNPRGLPIHGGPTSVPKATMPKKPSAQKKKAIPKKKLTKQEFRSLGPTYPTKSSNGTSGVNMKGMDDFLKERNGRPNFMMNIKFDPGIVRKKKKKDEDEEEMALSEAARRRLAKKRKAKLS
jgi:hypothetical protein